MTGQGLINHVRRVARWLRGRHGGVALMYALLIPFLLAGTGLAVDIGYWYQEQTSLQSAADAAAMSAARGSVAYNIATTSDTTSFVGSSSSQGPAYTFATTAANNATNNKYNFGTANNATIALTGNYTVNSTTSGTATYTATVTAPRLSFFSRVGMPSLGLAGLASGTQDASATVKVSEVLVAGSSSSPGGCTSGTACACGSFGTYVTASGNSRVTGTNCGLYAGGSLTTSGSSEITGSNVSTGQSSIGGLGNGYIGTGTPVLGTTSGVTYNASTPTDYLAGLVPPTWPTMPAGITSTSYTYTSATITNPLTLGQGNWTNLWNLSNSANTFNYGTTTGTSNIYGGVGGGSGGNGTTFNGTTYSITGSSSSVYGIEFTSCWNSSAAISLNGTYYNVQSYGTNYALYTGCGIASIGNTPTSGSWEQFYFKGGVKYANSITTVNHASGLYELSAYDTASTTCSSTSCKGGTNCSGTSCSNGAFVMTNGSSANIYLGTCSTSSYTPPITCSKIWPNTYFINGGLNLSGGINTVYFMPGVYYVENGYLDIGSGVNVVGTNVTFILQNNAGFIMGGGSTFNVSAPTTSTDPNCVTISQYPESSYSGTNLPYDGTGGHGICDVAIYQVSSDTAADYLVEGASNVINGAVYIPGSDLTVSGSGSMTITSNGYSSITAHSATLSGSGNLTLTENSPDTGSTSGGSGGSGSSTTTIQYAVYLLVS